MTKRNDIRTLSNSPLKGESMRPMRPMRLISLIGLIGLMGLGIMGCSEDERDDRRWQSVELVPYYKAVSEEVAAERRVSAPSGYYAYPGTGVYPQASTTHASIQVFMTQGNKVETQGAFQWKEDKWVSSVKFPYNEEGNESQNTFYVYGFMPSNATATSSSGIIRPREVENQTDDYKNGAVITLTNVPVITPADVCMIVGASDEASVSSGTIDVGSFRFIGQDAYAGGQNKLLLLLNHIYSSINFTFDTDKDYYKLRRIKLKEVQMKCAGKQKMNLKVTITPNQENPVKVTGEFTGEATDGSYVDLDIADKTKEIPSNNSGTVYNVPGFFTPMVEQTGGATTFTLRCTYDVYDAKGNLVRPDCSAENKITIAQTFYEGTSYTVPLTIEPTYLYQLSEFDLDNPTIKVGS